VFQLENQGFSWFFVPFLLCVMPKRPLTSDASTDSGDDGDYAMPVKRSSRKSKSSHPRTQKKTRDLHSKDRFENDELQGEVVNTRPHSTSLHSIISSGPARVALLKWFDGVHDVRGMPWRKRYDSTFDRDQRAQRAYEVLCHFNITGQQFDTLNILSV
jgi:A/G-specific adenine glycosylase